MRCAVRVGGYGRGDGGRGHHAEVIDGILAEGAEALALAAAVHVAADRVKLAGAVLTKRHPLEAFGDEDDPLRLAALVGIALALDRGRSLKARAA